MNGLIKRLREEIIPMFEKALSNGSSELFQNPHIVNCWKEFNCKSASCALHGNELAAARCWQVAGTYCGGEPQGTFVEKCGKCSDCKVFRDSCPTVVEEIGEQFNNIMFLFNKQKTKMLEDKEHIERLNRELISALEQIDIKNREIQKMMITDKLTGLYNRHHLVTVLEDEIARCNRYGHPLAIMMIDIDDFKSINEKYGQSTGDIMLEYVGVLIKENTRKFDRSFRYGGEEFIVVLPETDITLAYIVAERIRKGFEIKAFHAGRKGSVSELHISRTLSIGITATFPYKTNDISIEELLNQSDKALYLAKNKGGNMSVRFE
ncbi:MAG: GGDEF domain-containing protein [Nitrospiraceae bacterium]|nr:MAG: GGDEF domain-containing protein [Nitrospiraceae bacterium]